MRVAKTPILSKTLAAIGKLHRQLNVLGAVLKLGADRHGYKLGSRAVASNECRKSEFKVKWSDFAPVSCVNDLPDKVTGRCQQ